MKKRLVSLFVTARLYMIALPFAICYTGAAMNQAVLIANGGKFPVMVNDRLSGTSREITDRIIMSVDRWGFIDNVHCLMTNSTRLNWLADYLILGGRAYSPGDVLISIGLSLQWPLIFSWGALTISDVIKAKQRE